MNIPDNVKQICYTLDHYNAKPYLVGGCVRDMVMRKEVKDWDIEVYGIDLDRLHDVLKSLGPTQEVGKSFGVFKCGDVDVSVPRMDSKTGSGHKGFQVTVDKNMPLETACARRDFTMNAIMYDIFTGKYIDPYGGLEDIKAGLLHPVSPAFMEDPLRVLRAMQFIARFNLKPTQTTIEYSRILKKEYYDLPIERIRVEWEKLLMKGEWFREAFDFLYNCRWIEFYPQLKSIYGFPQDMTWHPEGCVITHTALGMQYLKRNCSDLTIDLMLGILCHDLAKPDHSEVKGDRIVSPGHNNVWSIPLLTNIGWNERQKYVLPLVREHMVMGSVSDKTKKRRFLNRLASRLHPCTVQQLYWIIRADEGSRGSASKTTRSDMLMDFIDECNFTDIPEPLITGDMVMAVRKLEPGPQVGKFKQQCYVAQLDCKFDTVEAGIKYLEGLN